MQILMSLQAGGCPLKFPWRVNEQIQSTWHRSGDSTQIQLRDSPAFILPPVKMTSMYADTLNLGTMGKQLKEHFLTGLQPKGISNDFLPCAAS